MNEDDYAWEKEMNEAEKRFDQAFDPLLLLNTGRLVGFLSQVERGSYLEEFITQHSKMTKDEVAEFRRLFYKFCDIFYRRERSQNND